MLYLFAGFELILLLVGYYSIRTSQLPSWITGNRYKVEGKSIRVLGFIMLIPSAAGFILGFIVGYKSFGNNLLISPLVDLAITIQMALILIVVFISIIFIIENIKPNKTDTMLEKNTQE